MLEISDVNEVSNLLLDFKDNAIGKLFLTPDWVKWLFTSPADKLNVIVIEFSVTALSILSRMKYERLSPEDPVVDDIVSLFKYCKGSLTIGKGRVNKVIDKVIEFSLVTEESCCGAPLLNEKSKVVGIHVNSNKLEKRGVLKAITIGSILEAFKTFITEKLGGQTENELWLEKIAQIPNNEFHLIGSGGFGKVYKIKESDSTETFVAVKVVSGLGSIVEYENQVHSLEKEYKLVTSLGNHPRIIQFFAIVPDNRNYRIMIVMEYMKNGSLADKLREHKPLPDNFVIMYLTQLLEGVNFLHRKEIYHSDIKPANILFTAEDNLKISDFGIAVGSQLQTTSSATSSHFQGDFHYMSPERLQGADRSAANDIWSVGATVVHMISGQPLNHHETATQLLMNIFQYKLCINKKPYKEYLQSLNKNDFKKKILSLTLCNPSNRANCQQLRRILLSHSKRLPAEALMEAGDESEPLIFGMCYNSARDELFLADSYNKVVRTIRLHDNTGDLLDVYRGTENDRRPEVSSVCHLSDSDSLLVCSEEHWQNESANWLVLLSREGSEWRETHRVRTAAAVGIMMLCCALSDSRVLVGQWNSKYMELFRVQRSAHIARPLLELFRKQNDARIAHVQRISVSEKYRSFSATCGSDTLVAMSFENDKSVRVNRLRDNRLEELTRIRLEKRPLYLMCLADRLLVTEWNEKQICHAVIEFELSATRLERRRELIAESEGIRVHRWCAVPGGLAIFDYTSRSLLIHK